MLNYTLLDDLSQVFLQVQPGAFSFKNYVEISVRCSTDVNVNQRQIVP